MQITTTKNLLAAARHISIHAEKIGDREDWDRIADHIELENYNNAAAAWRAMDTYSRDLLEDFAMGDSNVKHEAEAALSIEWNF